MKRSEVRQEETWDLSHIFADRQEWEKEFSRTRMSLKEVNDYRGKLANPEMALRVFRMADELGRSVERIYVYATMLMHTDGADASAVALAQRATTLSAEMSAAFSFVEPELTSLTDEQLDYMIAHPSFADYDYTLERIKKNKPHVLGEKEEYVLARMGEVTGSFRDIFEKIDSVDLPHPMVRAGEERVPLTHGTYSRLLQNPDRRVRKAAFQAYYKAYIGLINTITATYVANVDKDVFIARARKYDSCLAMAMASEDVDIKVYHNLLKSVNKNLPLLHRYYRDRKKMLGYKSMHMYDVYTTVVEDAEIKVDYEEAFRIVKEGLAPLGERYQALLQEAHDSGWIDVEETAGKRSGAYSISVFGLPHPYVLLNYQSTTSNVFTLAHELGHAMHSYHSERAQPQEKSDYKIFVAEVASTVNEVLLVKYLLKHTDDPKVKKYLLSYYMDTLKGTLFRQTQFAEFEFMAHDMAEKGQPLTKDVLNDAYLALNRKYYGRSVVSDPEIAYEWARIPHFYRSFYVYKYATGIISAVSIAERIYSEGAPAVEDYFRFLSSGGSDSPVELLKLAGVDLTKPDAFAAAMASFKSALEQFEALE